MFASQNVWQKSAAGFYYDPLAKTDLKRELQSGEQYGHGCMRATAQSFWK